jgi:hypothetical protein
MQITAMRLPLREATGLRQCAAAKDISVDIGHVEFAAA